MNIKIMRVLFFLLAFTVILSSCNKDPEMEELVNNPNTETTFNSFNGMVSAASSSGTSTESETCYDIAFPLTFLLEDGTTATAQTEEDIDAIFENEPYPVDWVYPINLVDEETGETVQANDEEELANYLIGCYEECEEIALGHIDCFEIVYPFSFELEDGSTIEVQDESQLEDIVFSENPPVDFVYPIQLIDEAGETISVNSEEELEELLDDACEEEEEEEEEWEECEEYVSGEIECFEIVFPFSFELEDGTTAQVEDEDELEEIIFSENPPVDFVYPIQLIDEDEVLYTVNSEDELDELLEEECEDWEDDEWGEFEGVVYPMTFVSVSIDLGELDSLDLEFEPCYNYVYPVSVENEEGEVLTADSDQELLAILLADNEIEDFVYPVSVIRLEDGVTVTINDEEDAWELIEDCLP